MNEKQNPRQTYPPSISTLTLAPSEEWEGFERQLEFQTAFDGRDEPGNYGIHGCDLKLILKGEEGASTLLIFTGCRRGSTTSTAICTTATTAPTPRAASAGTTAALFVPRGSSRSW